jgi:peptidoglycan/xylan/chitin deacetylase (PgdA/CDA1 family)
LKKTRLVASVSNVLVAALLGALPAAQVPGGSAPGAGGVVAITFDDLPAHGPLPPGVTRVDVAKSIIGALQERKAPPAYGFVNARLVEQQPADAEVLRMWRAAGLPLGNHTFSHMDPNASTVAAFEQDVIAGEPLVSSLMGNADWRWFRFPFLHEGDTAEKHQAVTAFLAGRGYKVAEVTIGFDDYAYNDPYARCRTKNDARGVEWLERSYLARAADSLARAQADSRAIFGRDIKHVMLLHVGAFQTVMLPRLLDLLHERGWTLTTLPDAASDPAYAKVAEGRTSWTGSFLDHHRPPRDAAPPRPADDFFQKIAGVCK